MVMLRERIWRKTAACLIGIHIGEFMKVRLMILSSMSWISHPEGHPRSHPLGFRALHLSYLILSVDRFASKYLSGEDEINGFAFVS